MGHQIYAVQKRERPGDETITNASRWTKVCGGLVVEENLVFQIYATQNGLKSNPAISASY